MAFAVFDSVLFFDVVRDGFNSSEATDRAVEELRAVFEDPSSSLADPAGVWIEPLQGEGV